MRRTNTSHVALALAAVALFVALGGPAWAKSALIGGRQIRNSAITSKKIARHAVHNSDLAKGSVAGANLKRGAVTTGRLANGAVTNGKLGDGSVTNGKLGDGSVTNGKLGDNAVSTTKLADASVTTGKLADQAVTTTKLADNSVTSAKVADNSLTATDVAPNTFLAANGSAVNALALGGVPASGYAQLASKLLLIGPNGAQETFFAIPTGFVRATCPSAGGVSHPAVSYDNASTAVEYGEEDVNGTAVHFTTINNGLVNSTDTVTSTTGLLRETMQVASKLDARASTVVVTGHVEGVVCHFTAQAVSTG